MSIKCRENCGNIAGECAYQKLSCDHHQDTSGLVRWLGIACSNCVFRRLEREGLWLSADARLYVEVRSTYHELFDDGGCALDLVGLKCEHGVLALTSIVAQSMNISG